MKNSKILCFVFVCGLAILVQNLQAQFISPNQPGRKGIDRGAAIGNQVATSTRLGINNLFQGQGGIIAANKLTGLDKKVIHTLKGTPGGDGGLSYYTSPFQASDGKLYGNTFEGGATGGWDMGMIYKYDPSTCTENTVLNNTPVSLGGTGDLNFANINELSDGKLYWATEVGGTKYLGAVGTVNKDGTGFTILHSFLGGTTTTANYTAGALESIGGVPGNVNGGFSCTKSPTYTVKYDGAYPRGFVTEGSDGKVYGTTYGGGTLGQGTVWRMDKNGANYEIISIGGGPGYFNKTAGYTTSPYETLTCSGGTGTKIYSPEGIFCHPWSNVTEGPDGKMYVVGVVGGYAAVGSVGRFDKDGGSPEIVHSFRNESGREDGIYPYRGVLIIDNKMYGTCNIGGGIVTPANGVGGLGTPVNYTVGAIGTVWSMNLDGGSFTKLHRFVGIGHDDGVYPYAGLIYDGTYLYGTTYLEGVRKSKDPLLGANSPGGTIFRVKPDGTNYKVVLTASGSADCAGKAGYQFGPSWERVTTVDVTCFDPNSCRIAPCDAGLAAPALSSTTLTNTCPATKVNLTLLTPTNLPSGAATTWHSATPATDANKLLSPTAVGAGTYYAAFKDAINNCYSGSPSGTATTAVTVTIKSCNSPIVLAAPVVQNKLTGEAHSGNAATETAPTGGTPGYTYSSGAADPLCVAPSGASPLPGASNLIITAGGGYTYTAPATPGTYYFCVKVCDSTSGTPQCNVAVYTVIVKDACAVNNNTAPVIK